MSRESERFFSCCTLCEKKNIFKKIVGLEFFFPRTPFAKSFLSLPFAPHAPSTPVSPPHMSTSTASPPSTYTSEEEAVFQEHVYTNRMHCQHCHITDVPMYGMHEFRPPMQGLAVLCKRCGIKQHKAIQEHWKERQEQMLRAKKTKQKQKKKQKAAPAKVRE